MHFKHMMCNETEANGAMSPFSTRSDPWKIKCGNKGNVPLC